MKKTISLISKGLTVLLFIFAMVACGSKVPDPASVAGKINAGQSLTEADYASMIDYCGKYAEEAQKYFDLINAQPNDSTAEAVKATDDLAGLYARYTYLDQFRNALAQADMSELGAENEKKVNEFAKYQAFPLPVGEGLPPTRASCASGTYPRSMPLSRSSEVRIAFSASRRVTRMRSWPASRSALIMAAI